MGLGRDRTLDPWICSQTRICFQTCYRLGYAVRYSEDVWPHKLCLQKIAFEIRLGFENLEIYTLQALWECYTDLLLTMGKHLGHNRTEQNIYFIDLNSIVSRHTQFDITKDSY